MMNPNSHIDPVLLSAYLDDEVSTQERTLVEAHLMRCEACNLELESLSWTVNLLGRLPDISPPRTFYITEAMLEREKAPRHRWWDWRYWIDVPWTPLRAGLAVILLFIILTQSISLNLLSPAAPKSEIVALSEAPPTMARAASVPTVELSERSAELAVQAVEATKPSLQVSVPSSAPNPALRTEFESENSQDHILSQRGSLLFITITLILLLAIGLVWWRRK